jgi:N-methylhydantoinase B
MAVDPITVKVINSYLESTAEEIGRRFRLSARSPVIREVGDCSAALFTADVQLIAQAAHVPAQLNSILPALEQTLQTFPLSRLAPGDVLVTNDPYSGVSAGVC